MRSAPRTAPTAMPAVAPVESPPPPPPLLELSLELPSASEEEEGKEEGLEVESVPGDVVVVELVELFVVGAVSDSEEFCLGVTSSPVLFPVDLYKHVFSIKLGGFSCEVEHYKTFCNCDSDVLGVFELGRVQRLLHGFLCLDLPFYILKISILVGAIEPDLFSRPVGKLEDSAVFEIVVEEKNNVGCIIITIHITSAPAYGLSIVALSADT
ncbi:hypothetical protein HG530_004758 [Fusarium avenaceum]|nr:hypothetical protein HG530_004758 [Fusarium avenaceum]